MTFAYEIGEHVRLSDRLEADWRECRAEVVDNPEDTGWGRITDRYTDSGFCGQCDYDDVDCPGPWYIIENAGRDGVFEDGTIYGEHELISAQEILMRQLDVDLSMQEALW